MSFEGHVMYSEEHGWVWYIMRDGKLVERHQDVNTSAEAFTQMYQEINEIRDQALVTS